MRELRGDRTTTGVPRRRLRVALDPRPERLFRALLDAGIVPLGGDPSPVEVFRPRTIVVGNHQSREWLEIAWAREFGIAAGLETPSLGGLFERLAESAFGELPPKATAALRPMALTARIDCLLDRVEAANRDDLLARFLDRVRDPAQRLRLAGSLAHQFAELRREHPEFLAEWEHTPPRDDTVAGIWHRLHRDLETTLGASESDRLPPTTGTARLSELAAALADGRVEALDADLARGVAIFGVDRISPVEARIVEALSRHTEVWLGVYSPTSGFVDPTEHGATQDLCRRLALPARDLRETLTEDLGLDHEDFESPLDELDDEAPTTLLRVFQRQVRLGESSDGTAGSPKLPFVDPWQDHSFEVHEADGPRREAEIARERVLAALDDDERIAPDDVLILVPDLDAYASPLRAAFASLSQRSPGLALTFADRPPSELDDVHRTMLDLFALLDGPIGIGSTFEVLRSPTVAARFALGDDEIEDCLDLARRAGISWGLDLDHRRRCGSPETFRLGTWKAGIDRLILGHLYGFETHDSEGGPATLPESVTLPSGLQVPTSHGFVERAGRIESLAELVDSLESSLRDVSRDRPRFEWPNVLRSILDGFFAPSGASELRSYQLGLRAIDEIERQLSLVPDVDRERAVSFTRVRALFEETLSGLVRGPQFSGTPTVARLGSSRPTPSKVTVILGLTEQAFPGDPATSPLDRLEGKRGRLGIDLRAERSEAFLNALISAESRVILTAPCRSVVDGTERTPSSVLVEVLQWFDRSFEARSNGERMSRRLVCRHPLRADDEACFDSAGDARTSDPRLVTSDPSALRTWEIRNRSDRHDRSRSRSWFRDEVDHRSDRDPATSEPITIDLADLESLWRAPARWYLRDRLKARLLQEEAPVRDTELQTLDGLARYRLTSQLLDQEEMPEDALLRSSGIAPPSPAASPAARSSWLTSQAFLAFRRIEPLRTKDGVPERIEIALDLDLPARAEAPSFPARRVRLEGELTGLSETGVLMQTPVKSETGWRLVGRLRQAIATLYFAATDPGSDPNVQLFVQTRNNSTLVDPARFAALTEQRALELVALFVEGLISTNDGPLPFDPKLCESGTILITDDNGDQSLNRKRAKDAWSDACKHDAANRLLALTSAPGDSDRCLSWVSALIGLVTDEAKSKGRKKPTAKKKPSRKTSRKTSRKPGGRN